MSISDGVVLQPHCVVLLLHVSRVIKLEHCYKSNHLFIYLLRFLVLFVDNIYLNYICVC